MARADDASEPGAPSPAPAAPGSDGLTLVDCTLERHGAAILAILNDAIAHSTALYDYHPRPPEAMVGWFTDKAAHGHPVIGLEDADGALVGFATYGAFRPRPANKYTVEHSVYVHADHRGHGHGRVLLEHIVERAARAGVHVLVGGIDAGNAASIRLHERLGFTHAGTVREVGFKFGRWLDLAFYQHVLATPERPIDG